MMPQAFGSNSWDASCRHHHRDLSLVARLCGCSARTHRDKERFPVMAITKALIGAGTEEHRGVGKQGAR